MMGKNLKLIVGLGNPGEKYKMNRHNIGFMIIERFAKKFNIYLSHRKKKTIFGRGFCDGNEVVLLKPQTFMNLSGEAVLYLASFLKINTSNIIAVMDDTELPFGIIRIRSGGGSGGHNGIKSLIYSLRSEDFPRVRFGVGRPPLDFRKELSEYVLEDFSPQEMETLDEKLDKAIDALYTTINDSIETAMNKFNNK